MRSNVALKPVPQVTSPQTFTLPSWLPRSVFAANDTRAKVGRSIVPQLSPKWARLARYAKYARYARLANPASWAFDLMEWDMNRRGLLTPSGAVQVPTDIWKSWPGWTQGTYCRAGGTHASRIDPSCSTVTAESTIVNNPPLPGATRFSVFARSGLISGVWHHLERYEMNKTGPGPTWLGNPRHRVASELYSPGARAPSTQDPNTNPEALPPKAPRPDARVAPFAVRVANQGIRTANNPWRASYRVTVPRNVFEPPPAPVRPPGKPNRPNPRIDDPVTPTRPGRNPRRHVRRPPGRRTAERKVKLNMPALAEKFIKAVTELDEKSQILYKSLPCKLQNKFDNQPKRLQKIYENWHLIDVEKAIWLAIMDEVEDTLIGLASKKENEIKEWMFDNYGWQSLLSPSTKASRSMTGLEAIDRQLDDLRKDREELKSNGGEC